MGWALYDRHTEENGWQGWRHQAACRDLDTNLFFPDGEGAGVAAQVAEAKAVCARCPVREDCLDFALASDQSYGIFGGLTETERRSLRRRLARQRRLATAELSKAG